jgi:8-oxo-dGTP pyrophosphatase MutT (NUDIX family)
MKRSTIVFLVKRDDVYLSEKKKGFGKGFLNGYGGKVGEESIEAAAVRELYEEAGVKADPAKLEKAAVIDFYNGEELLYECHVFFTDDWIGEPRESEEMALPRAYTRASLPYEKMWQADRSWLPLVFSGKKIRAEGRYVEGLGEVKSFDYKVVESFPAASVS